ncbi:MAG: HEAT repeat domain-containing protein [Desulfobacterales bacterium]|jgi:hypothetical protein
MVKEKLSGRKLKKKILKLLTRQDFNKGLEEIRRLPARQAVNPLFSFLFSLDETVKWRCVTAFGEVVARLAQSDLESARIIMRRLMWNLNDESGGIGWGSPEAMGEIMARSQELADEYAHILVSYIRPDGNFLEHEALQRGVLWGLGRLARIRPEVVEDAAVFLQPHLRSEDATLRGLAVWVAGALSNKSTRAVLKSLANDKARCKIFSAGKLVELTVGDLAQEALIEA